MTLSQNFTFTLATLVATLDAADFDSPVVLTANGTQYGIRDISVRGSEMLVHFNELESDEGHFFVGLLVFTLLGTGNLQTLTLSSDVRAMANRNHVTAHVKTSDETLWLTDDGRLHRYREIHATDQLPLPTTADNARYLGATDGEYEFKDFAGVTAFQATWQGKTGLTSSAFVEVMEILEVDIGINEGGFTLDQTGTDVTRVVLPSDGIYQLHTALYVTGASARTTGIIRFLLEDAVTAAVTRPATFGSAYVRGFNADTDDSAIASTVLVEANAGDAIGVEFLNTAGQTFGLTGGSSALSIIKLEGSGAATPDGEAGQQAPGVGNSYADATGRKSIILYQAAADDSQPGAPANPHDGSDFLSTFGSWEWGEAEAREAVTDPVIMWEARGGYDIADDGTVTNFEWVVVPELTLRYTPNVADNDLYTYVPPTTGRFWWSMLIPNYLDGGGSWSVWIQDGRGSIVSDELWYQYAPNTPTQPVSTFTTGAWTPANPSTGLSQWRRTQAAAANDGDSSQTLWIYRRHGSLAPVGIATVSQEIVSGWWIEYADDDSGTNNSTTYDASSHQYVSYRESDGSLTPWIFIGTREGEAVWSQLVDGFMHVTTPNGVKTRGFNYDISEYGMMRFTVYTWDVTVGGVRMDRGPTQQCILYRPPGGWPVRDTNTATTIQDNEEMQFHYDGTAGLSGGFIHDFPPSLVASRYGPLSSDGTNTLLPFRLWWFAQDGTEENVSQIGTTGQSVSHDRWNLTVEGAP